MNEQNKKINILLGVLFLVLLIAVFIIILDPTKKPNEYVYNGFLVSRFRLQSAPDITFHNIDLYVAGNKYSLPIRNSPKELESIPVTGLDKLSWLKPIKESDNYDVTANTIFLTFDPDMSGGDLIIAGGEIVRVLGSGSGGIYKKLVQGAFTRSVNGTTSTKTKTCEDATKYVGIIRLELGGENKVYTEGDCVILEGKSYPDLIRVSDRFLLALLGVIK